jgi:dipeptidyl aminopeptidase/acylaminoacyl peptidase
MRDQRRSHDPLSILMRAYDPSQEALHSNRLAYQSSPLAAVGRWRSPVLMIHGDDDRSVPFFNMVRAVEALRRADVEFEQLVLPNEGHSFLLYRSWLEALTATADFFERKL